MKSRLFLGSVMVLAVGVGLLVGLAPGCSSEGVVPPGEGGGGDSNRISPAEVDGRLVSANTRFGFRVFSGLVEGGVPGNVFISPSSVSFALTMTLNGAAGETEEAMAEALEIRDLSMEEVNEANAALVAWLEQADPRVTLAIANSLWGREGVPFYPEFLETNEAYFGAEVQSLDFADRRAPGIINEWVSRATRGKITEIVDAIPSEAILYLINAVYFKGPWKTEFDPSETRDRPFTLADGTEKPVPIMHQEGTFDYLRGDGFQAVGLPYGEGRMRMYVFLPDADSGLEAFLAELDATLWEEWMARFRPMEGDLGLPRFEVEYEEDLSALLKSLGMAIAFDQYEADFSRMLPVSSLQNAYISRVKHKTYVKVNEEGTEAAAATSVEVGITSVPQRFTMVVDRPFFFAIRDDATGTVLFLGAIVDPA